jgi:chromosome segregation ATPase
VKTSTPDLEAEIANAAMRAVRRSGVSVVAARAPLPPIDLAPRGKSAPPRARRVPKPEPEPFDVLDTLDQVAPSVDAEGRRYPRLGELPRNRERELEHALKDQWKELSARCIQIVDLHNTQRQQAADLQTAREALAELDKSVGMLQAALSQQENETAAAKKAHAQSKQEMAALQARFEATQGDAAKLQRQAGLLKTAFDERGAALATARQRIDALEAALAAKTAEAETLAAPIDEERRLHRAEVTQQRSRNEIEVSQQRVRYEFEIGRLTRLLAERENQLNSLHGAHTRVAKRYEALARTTADFEAAQKTARDHAKSQAELIQVLEALLKVERETAEQKIAELAAALEQERVARADAERTSTTMRKDIVHLLPKLVARRDGVQAPAKREDAA